MPSTFTFPLTPPETNTEVKNPSVSLHDHLAGLDYRPERHPTTSGNTESPGTRFRRVSSIAYHNSSGLRETRGPNHGHPKSFIVVIPPAMITRERGHLGHTLSTGPDHRLSQGILMPLFPTLYGQLTAIAREFNFPSTAGLCLYFQYTENGITTTPRILDESWQSFWGYLSDGPTPSSERRPPIAGRVEFDIDFQHARWYATWITSRQRELRDQSVHHIPSSSQSLVHYPGESRTTVADFRILQDYAAEKTPPQQPIAPITRHIPKKLSLVERFDVLSARSDLKATRSDLSPPDELPITSRVLSPIFQQEEPKSAMHDLHTRVKSWRASALPSPRPLPKTGHTSLEPENSPNNISIPGSSTPSPTELKLEDYSWSITSAGPDCCASEISSLSSRVPSVHITGRLEGSVALTPSTCTSFGPSDDTASSLLLSFHLPSPDLGHRMREDATPSTSSNMTSWGPLSPSSPLHEAHSPNPSLDLGERSLFSRPATPSTGTSWGPSSPSQSIAPSSVFGPSSVHLGDRGEFSRPISPVTATSWGVPSYPPSPVTPYRIHTPDAGHRGFEDAEDYVNFTSKISPWRHVWPYQRNEIHGYPHFSLYPVANASTRAFVSQNATAYPNFELYPAVYPYHLDEIYPVMSLGVYDSEGSQRADQSQVLQCPEGLQLTEYSTFNSENLCDPVVRYPTFHLYPPVYPYFDLYSGLGGLNECEAVAEVKPGLPPSILHETAHYPVFDLYPTVYPNLNLYPAVLEKNLISGSVGGEPSYYPGFNLYPALYPHFELYSAVYSHHDSCQVTSTLKETEVDPTSSPPKNLAFISCRYPDPYPPQRGSEPQKNADSVPRLAGSGEYPVLDIYPAVSHFTSDSFRNG